MKLAIAFMFVASAEAFINLNSGCCSLSKLGGVSQKSLDIRTNQGFRSCSCSVSMHDSEALSRRGLLLRSVFAFPVLIQSANNAYAKPTKVTAEETVAAWKRLNEVQGLLKSADAMVEKKEWESILQLLDNDLFKDIEVTLLKLVNGPILSQEDKKAIGTRKRYGIAADVLFGIGGVQSAIATLKDPQLQVCSAGVCSGKFVETDVEVPKSLKSLNSSLNEILNVCKAYKEFL